MIKIVISDDLRHEYHVKDALEELQKEGFIVTKIEKKQRSNIFNLFLADDITHIHYENK